MRRTLIFITVISLLSTVACEGIRPSDAPPPRNFGSFTENINTATYSPRYLDGVGAVRINCEVSHFNYSDPILFPGKPFASHLHMFFGNTLTNWESTSESIATTGGSTCSGGTANRTAYWAPALINTNGRDWRDCVGKTPHTDCELMVPGGDQTRTEDCSRNRWTQWCVDQRNATQVYYKTGYQGVASNTVQNWPAGLRMIAGDSKATTPQPHTIWTCRPTNQGDVNHPHYKSIMETGCQAGQLLVMGTEFPQCWNGRDLDSPDHKSHMSYALGWPDKGCPASHPVPLPQVTQWVYYRLPADVELSHLRLVSDMYDGPAGYSNHADWWHGWNPDVFQKVVDNCYAPGLDCQMNLLGDGTALDESGFKYN